MSEAVESPGLRPGMTACHWGSVNQWECDENDHLNVRFYAHKVNQAIQIMVSPYCDTAPDDVLAAIRHQHIRFLAECRAATPLRVDCGIIRRTAGTLELLSLMHDNVSGRVTAAFTTALALPAGPFAELPLVALPDHAGPRGIDPASVPTPPDDLDQVRASGYRIVGRGVIGSEECDGAGRLLPHGYVGRISDGMPNLWAFLNAGGGQSAGDGNEQGGAALEQRLTILAPLERGCVFTQLSGVRALGNKTQHMAHVLYDERCGRIAAVMEAVGVAMDLTTRRSVPISPQRRRHLESLLLR